MVASRLLRTFLLGSLVVSTAACSAWREKSGSPDSERITMRVYKVPKDYADNARWAISVLLKRDDKKDFGRAEIAGNGELLVSAPESFQQGVQDFVDSLAKAPPLPLTKRSYKLHCWLVLGRPVASESNAAKFGDLMPALTEINKAQGPYQFLMAEQLEGNGLLKEELKIKGSLVTLTIKPWLNGNDLESQLNVDVNGNDIRAKVMIPPGNLLVLGQFGRIKKDDNPLDQVAQGLFPGQKSADATPAADRMYNVFTILRATVE